MSAGSSYAPCATAANAPIPRADDLRRAPRPRPRASRSWEASERARSASAEGVMWFAGVFWRSRIAFTPSATTAARETTRRDVVMGGDDQRREARSRRRSSRRLERVEAVGAPSASPRRAPPATSSPTLCGSSQQSDRADSSRARPTTRRGGDPRALGVELVARAAARRGSSASPSAWATDSARNRAFASPESTSAWSVPSGTSCGIPLPSKTPMTSVSASVSTGASVVAETRMGRRGTLSSQSVPSRNRSLRPMPKTVILGTARTPIGKLGGGLSSLDATTLGGTAIESALERAKVEPEQVDHVVMGQVLQAGQGQIPSRQAQIKAGIPKEVSSETINKVCASGVRAVGILDAAIRAGDVNVGVGGGMESMSQAPYLLPQARFGYRMGDAKALDAMVHDGLTNPFSGKQMFVEATEVGEELEMTRPDLDKWALRSHERALAAIDEGRMSDEIVPVTVKSRKGETRRRGRRGPAPRVVARGAREAARAHGQGGQPHRRKLSGCERRRRRARPLQRRVGAAERQGGPRRDRRPGAGRRRLPLPRPHARQRREEAARPARDEGRGRRHLGDQRGVRVGRRSTRSACSASTPSA